MKETINILFAISFLLISDAMLAADLPFQETEKLVKQGNADAQKALGSKYDSGENYDQFGINYWKLPFQEIEKLAKQGNADAQKALGGKYNSGESYDQFGNKIPRDDVKAMYWYEKAAKQGHAEALYSLGLMHYMGDGTAKNPDKAESLFKQAIPILEKQIKNKENIRNKYFILGQMYQWGWGVAPDISKAISLYEEGARKGEFASMNSLGMFYYNQSEKPDHRKSHYWYNRNCKENPDDYFACRAASAIREEYKQKCDADDISACDFYSQLMQDM